MGYTPNGRGHRIMERLAEGPATFASLCHALRITGDRYGAKRRLSTLLEAMERHELVVIDERTFYAGRYLPEALDDLNAGDEYAVARPSLRVFHNSQRKAA